MREKKEWQKNKWIYGQFVRGMSETADEEDIWNRLRRAEVKIEAEALMSARTDNPDKLCQTQYWKLLLRVECSFMN